MHPYRIMAVSVHIMLFLAAFCAVVLCTSAAASPLAPIDPSCTLKTVVEFHEESDFNTSQPTYFGGGVVLQAKVNVAEFRWNQTVVMFGNVLAADMVCLRHAQNGGISFTSSASDGSAATITSGPVGLNENLSVHVSILESGICYLYINSILEAVGNCPVPALVVRWENRVRESAPDYVAMSGTVSDLKLSACVVLPPPTAYPAPDCALQAVVGFEDEKDFNQSQPLYFGGGVVMEADIEIIVEASEDQPIIPIFTFGDWIGQGLRYDVSLKQTLTSLQFSHGSDTVRAPKPLSPSTSHRVYITMMPLTPDTTTAMCFIFVDGVLEAQGISPVPGMLVRWQNRIGQSFSRNDPNMDGSVRNFKLSACNVLPAPTEQEAPTCTLSTAVAFQNENEFNESQPTYFGGGVVIEAKVTLTEYVDGSNIFSFGMCGEAVECPVSLSQHLEGLSFTTQTGGPIVTPLPFGLNVERHVYIAVVPSGQSATCYIYIDGVKQTQGTCDAPYLMVRYLNRIGKSRSTALDMKGEVRDFQLRACNVLPAPTNYPSPNCALQTVAEFTDESEFNQSQATYFGGGIVVEATVAVLEETDGAPVFGFSNGIGVEAVMLRSSGRGRLAFTSTPQTITAAREVGVGVEHRVYVSIVPIQGSVESWCYLYVDGLPEMQGRCQVPPLAIRWENKIAKGNNLPNWNGTVGNFKMSACDVLPAPTQFPTPNCTLHDVVELLGESEFDPFQATYFGGGVVIEAKVTLTEYALYSMVFGFNNALSTAAMVLSQSGSGLLSLMSTSQAQPLRSFRPFGLNVERTVHIVSVPSIDSSTATCFIYIDGLMEAQGECPVTPVLERRDNHIGQMSEQVKDFKVRACHVLTPSHFPEPTCTLSTAVAFQNESEFNQSQTTDFGGGMVIEAKVLFTEYAEGTQPVFSFSNGHWDAVSLRQEGEGGGLVFISGPGYSFYVPGPFGLNVERSVFISMVPNLPDSTQGTCFIYLDGVLQGQGVCPVPQVMARYTSRVGIDDFGTLHGNVSEFKLSACNVLPAPSQYPPLNCAAQTVVEFQSENEFNESQATYFGGGIAIEAKVTLTSYSDSAPIFLSCTGAEKMCIQLKQSDTSPGHLTLETFSSTDLSKTVTSLIPLGRNVERSVHIAVQPLAPYSTDATCFIFIDGVYNVKGECYVPPLVLRRHNLIAKSLTPRVHAGVNVRKFSLRACTVLEAPTQYPAPACSLSTVLEFKEESEYNQSQFTYFGGEVVIEANVTLTSYTSDADILLVGNIDGSMVMSLTVTSGSKLAFTTPDKNGWASSVVSSTSFGVGVERYVYVSAQVSDDGTSSFCYLYIDGVLHAVKECTLPASGIRWRNFIGRDIEGRANLPGTVRDFKLNGCHVKTPPTAYPAPDCELKTVVEFVDLSQYNQSQATYFGGGIEVELKLRLTEYVDSADVFFFGNVVGGYRTKESSVLTVQSGLLTFFPPGDNSGGMKALHRLELNVEYNIRMAVALYAGCVLFIDGELQALLDSWVYVSNPVLNWQNYIGRGINGTVRDFKLAACKQSVLPAPSLLPAPNCTLHTAVQFTEKSDYNRTQMTQFGGGLVIRAKVMVRQYLSSSIMQFSTYYGYNEMGLKLGYDGRISLITSQTYYSGAESDPSIITTTDPIGLNVERSIYVTIATDGDGAHYGGGRCYIYVDDVLQAQGGCLAPLLVVRQEEIVAPLRGTVRDYKLSSCVVLRAPTQFPGNCSLKTVVEFKEQSDFNTSQATYFGGGVSIDLKLKVFGTENYRSSVFQFGNYGEDDSIALVLIPSRNPPKANMITPGDHGHGTDADVFIGTDVERSIHLSIIPTYYDAEGNTNATCYFFVDGILQYRYKCNFPALDVRWLSLIGRAPDDKKQNLNGTVRDFTLRACDVLPAPTQFPSPNCTLQTVVEVSDESAFNRSQATYFGGGITIEAKVLFTSYTEREMSVFRFCDSSTRECVSLVQYGEGLLRFTSGQSTMTTKSAFGLNKQRTVHIVIIPSTTYRGTAYLFIDGVIATDIDDSFVYPPLKLRRQSSVGASYISHVSDFKLSACTVLPAPTQYPTPNCTLQTVVEFQNDTEYNQSQALYFGGGLVIEAKVTVRGYFQIFTFGNGVHDSLNLSLTSRGKLSLTYKYYTATSSLTIVQYREYRVHIVIEREGHCYFYIDDVLQVEESFPKQVAFVGWLNHVGEPATHPNQVRDFKLLACEVYPPPTSYPVSNCTLQTFLEFQNPNEFNQSQATHFGGGLEVELKVTITEYTDTAQQVFSFANGDEGEQDSVSLEVGPSGKLSFAVVNSDYPSGVVVTKTASLNTSVPFGLNVERSVYISIVPTPESMYKKAFAFLHIDGVVAAQFADFVIPQTLVRWQNHIGLQTGSSAFHGTVRDFKVRACEATPAPTAPVPDCWMQTVVAFQNATSFDPSGFHFGGGFVVEAKVTIPQYTSSTDVFNFGNYGSTGVRLTSNAAGRLSLSVAHENGVEYCTTSQPFGLDVERTVYIAVAPGTREDNGMCFIYIDNVLQVQQLNFPTPLVQIYRVNRIGDRPVFPNIPVTVRDFRLRACTVLGPPGLPAPTCQRSVVVAFKDESEYNQSQATYFGGGSPAGSSIAVEGGVVIEAKLMITEYTVGAQVFTFGNGKYDMLKLEVAGPSGQLSFRLATPYPYNTYHMQTTSQFGLNVERRVYISIVRNDDDTRWQCFLFIDGVLEVQEEYCQCPAANTRWQNYIGESIPGGKPNLLGTIKDFALSACEVLPASRQLASPRCYGESDVLQFANTSMFDGSRPMVFGGGITIEADITFSEYTTVSSPVISFTTSAASDAVTLSQSGPSGQLIFTTYGEGANPTTIQTPKPFGLNVKRRVHISVLDEPFVYAGSRVYCFIYIDGVLEAQEPVIVPRVATRWQNAVAPEGGPLLLENFKLSACDVVLPATKYPVPSCILKTVVDAKTQSVSPFNYTNFGGQFVAVANVSVTEYVDNAIIFYFGLNNRLTLSMTQVGLLNLVYDNWHHVLTTATPFGLNVQRSIHVSMVAYGAYDLSVNVSIYIDGVLEALSTTLKSPSVYLPEYVFRHINSIGVGVEGFHDLPGTVHNFSLHACEAQPPPQYPTCPLHTVLEFHGDNTFNQSQTTYFGGEVLVEMNLTVTQYTYGATVFIFSNGPFQDRLQLSLNETGYLELRVYGPSTKNPNTEGVVVATKPLGLHAVRNVMISTTGSVCYIYVDHTVVGVGTCEMPPFMVRWLNRVGTYPECISCALQGTVHDFRLSACDALPAPTPVTTPSCELTTVVSCPSENDFNKTEAFYFGGGVVVEAYLSIAVYKKYTKPTIFVFGNGDGFSTDSLKLILDSDGVVHPVIAEQYGADFSLLRPFGLNVARAVKLSIVPTTNDTARFFFYVDGILHSQGPCLVPPFSLRRLNRIGDRSGTVSNFVMQACHVAPSPDTKPSCAQKNVVSFQDENDFNKTEARYFGGGVEVEALLSIASYKSEAVVFVFGNGDVVPADTLELIIRTDGVLYPVIAGISQYGAEVSSYQPFGQHVAKTVKLSIVPITDDTAKFFLVVDGVLQATGPCPVPPLSLRRLNRIGESVTPGISNLDGSVSNFLMQACETPLVPISYLPAPSCSLHTVVEFNEESEFNKSQATYFGGGVVIEAKVTISAEYQPNAAVFIFGNWMSNNYGDLLLVQSATNPGTLTFGKMRSEVFGLDTERDVYISMVAGVCYLAVDGALQAEISCILPELSVRWQSYVSGVRSLKLRACEVLPAPTQLPGPDCALQTVMEFTDESELNQYKTFPTYFGGGFVLEVTATLKSYPEDYYPKRCVFDLASPISSDSGEDQLEWIQMCVGLDGFPFISAGSSYGGKSSQAEPTQAFVKDVPHLVHVSSFGGWCYLYIDTVFHGSVRCGGETSLRWNNRIGSTVGNHSAWNGTISDFKLSACNVHPVPHRPEPDCALQTVVEFADQSELNTSQPTFFGGDGLTVELKVTVPDLASLNYVFSFQNCGKGMYSCGIALTYDYSHLNFMGAGLGNRYFDYSYNYLPFQQNVEHHVYASIVGGKSYIFVDGILQNQHGTTNYVSTALIRAETMMLPNGGTVRDFKLKACDVRTPPPMAYPAPTCDLKTVIEFADISEYNHSATYFGGGVVLEATVNTTMYNTTLSAIFQFTNLDEKEPDAFLLLFDSSYDSGLPWHFQSGSQRANSGSYYTSTVLSQDVFTPYLEHKVRISVVPDTPGSWRGMVYLFIDGVLIIQRLAYTPALMVRVISRIGEALDAGPDLRGTVKDFKLSACDVLPAPTYVSPTCALKPVLSFANQDEYDQSTLTSFGGAVVLDTKVKITEFSDNATLFYFGALDNTNILSLTLTGTSGVAIFMGRKTRPLKLNTEMHLHLAIVPDPDVSSSASCVLYVDGVAEVQMTCGLPQTLQRNFNHIGTSAPPNPDLKGVFTDFTLQACNVRTPSQFPTPACTLRTVVEFTTLSQYNQSRATYFGGGVVIEAKVMFTEYTDGAEVFSFSNIGNSDVSLVMGATGILTLHFTFMVDTYSYSLTFSKPFGLYVERSVYISFVPLSKRVYVLIDGVFEEEESCYKVSGLEFTTRWVNHVGLARTGIPQMKGTVRDFRLRACQSAPPPTQRFPEPPCALQTVVEFQDESDFNESQATYFGGEYAVEMKVMLKSYTDYATVFAFSNNYKPMTQADGTSIDMFGIAQFKEGKLYLYIGHSSLGFPMPIELNVEYTLYIAAVKETIQKWNFFTRTYLYLNGVLVYGAAGSGGAPPPLMVRWSSKVGERWGSVRQMNGTLRDFKLRACNVLPAPTQLPEPNCTLQTALAFQDPAEYNPIHPTYFGGGLVVDLKLTLRDYKEFTYIFLLSPDPDPTTNDLYFLNKVLRLHLDETLYLGQEGREGGMDLNAEINSWPQMELNVEYKLHIAMIPGDREGYGQCLIFIDGVLATSVYKICPILTLKKRVKNVFGTTPFESAMHPDRYGLNGTMRDFNLRACSAVQTPTSFPEPNCTLHTVVELNAELNEDLKALYFGGGIVVEANVTITEYTDGAPLFRFSNTPDADAVSLTQSGTSGMVVLTVSGSGTLSVGQLLTEPIGVNVEHSLYFSILPTVNSSTGTCFLYIDGVLKLKTICPVPELLPRWDNSVGKAGAPAPEVKGVFGYFKLSACSVLPPTQLPSPNCALQTVVEFKDESEYNQSQPLYFGGGVVMEAKVTVTEYTDNATVVVFGDTEKSLTLAFVGTSGVLALNGKALSQPFGLNVERSVYLSRVPTSLGNSAACFVFIDGILEVKLWCDSPVLLKRGNLVGKSVSGYQELHGTVRDFSLKACDVLPISDLTPAPRTVSPTVVPPTFTPTSTPPTFMPTPAPPTFMPTPAPPIDCSNFIYEDVCRHYKYAGCSWEWRGSRWTCGVVGPTPVPPVACQTFLSLSTCKQRSDCAWKFSWTIGPRYVCGDRITAGPKPPTKVPATFAPFTPWTSSPPSASPITVTPPASSTPQTIAPPVSSPFPTSLPQTGALRTPSPSHSLSTLSPPVSSPIPTASQTPTPASASLTTLTPPVSSPTPQTVAPPVSSPFPTASPQTSAPSSASPNTVTPPASSPTPQTVAPTVSSPFPTAAPQTSAPRTPSPSHSLSTLTPPVSSPTPTAAQTRTPKEKPASEASSTLSPRTPAPSPFLSTTSPLDASPVTSAAPDTAVPQSGNTSTDSSEAEDEDPDTHTAPSTSTSTSLVWVWAVLGVVAVLLGAIALFACWKRRTPSECKDDTTHAFMDTELGEEIQMGQLDLLE